MKTDFVYVPSEISRCEKSTAIAGVTVDARSGDGELLQDVCHDLFLRRNVFL